MSSFIDTFIHKKSGAEVKVFCLDDYFGQHEYGYFVEGIDEPMKHDKFYELYERA